MTTTATNQPLHRPTGATSAPRGRSFLNDALEAATERRGIHVRADWDDSDTDEPLPGDESRKQMSAEVRAAAGYTNTNEEDPNNA